jgi:hypothetical protein
MIVTPKRKENELFSQDAQVMHLIIPLLRGGSWDCQILNQMIASQLFTSLRTRYNQWLSDIQVIQVSAFPAYDSWINSCFTARKELEIQNSLKLNESRWRCQKVISDNLEWRISRYSQPCRGNQSVSKMSTFNTSTSCTRHPWSIMTCTCSTYIERAKAICASVEVPRTHPSHTLIGALFSGSGEIAAKKSRPRKSCVWHRTTADTNESGVGRALLLHLTMHSGEQSRRVWRTCASTAAEARLLFVCS